MELAGGIPVYIPVPRSPTIPPPQGSSLDPSPGRQYGPLHPAPREPPSSTLETDEMRVAPYAQVPEPSGADEVYIPPMVTPIDGGFRNPTRKTANQTAPEGLYTASFPKPYAAPSHVHAPQLSVPKPYAAPSHVHDPQFSVPKPYAAPSHVSDPQTYVKPVPVSPGGSVVMPDAEYVPTTFVPIDGGFKNPSRHGLGVPQPQPQLQSMGPATPSASAAGAATDADVSQYGSPQASLSPYTLPAPVVFVVTPHTTNSCSVCHHTSHCQLL